MASASVPPRVNPWNALGRKDLTTHPYKATNLILEFKDKCKRPLFRLITSLLAHFGKMITERDDTDYSKETPRPGDYLVHSRLFKDKTTIVDYNHQRRKPETDYSSVPTTMSTSCTTVSNEFPTTRHKHCQKIQQYTSASTYLRSNID